jgi:hypothetical protein
MRRTGILITTAPAAVLTTPPGAQGSDGRVPTVPPGPGSTFH